MAAVGLMSSVLPGALRGSLKEAAETQRATAIIRLPSGRNTRVVCAVTPLHPSDPESTEQGGGSGGGARVLAASGAPVNCVEPPKSPRRLAPSPDALNLRPHCPPYTAADGVYQEYRVVVRKPASFPVAAPAGAFST